MSTKYIFLDIDGVMCTHPHYKHKDPDTHMTYFVPQCVGYLNDLIEATDAQIVVSSTWRVLEDWEKLRMHFKLCGVSRMPISSTPDLAKPAGSKMVDGQWVTPEGRGIEVMRWLEINAPHGTFTTDYVIFDDDRDMLPHQIEKNFVWVQEGMFKGGLKHEHVQAAIKILNDN